MTDPKPRQTKTPRYAETFAALREIGTAWDNIICVCRELMKDYPCECNCKEFHDESLTNEISKPYMQE